jgi:hypothetical protein
MNLTLHNCQNCMVIDSSSTFPFMYHVTTGCVDQSLRLMIKAADSTVRHLMWKGQLHI